MVEWEVRDPMFYGIYSALVTPFKKGKIDESAFSDLLEWQINQGIHGVVVGGTTGEAPTLSQEDYVRLLDMTLEIADRRVPVIAGAGSPSTEEAMALCQVAHKRGADGILVVNPYYNKPSQEGLYLHYKSIHDGIDLPLLLYNNPGRSAGEISVETVARLAELPRVVGIKDASPNLGRVLEIHCLLGDEFVQLSGNDETMLGYWAMGGNGGISVTANVAPSLCVDLYQAWAEEDLPAAFMLRDRLHPLNQALFTETSPGPVKYALSLLGFGEPDVRLPLAPITPAARAQVEEALRECDLLESDVKFG
jgi:4-hydroxy-tetrahydrodipicolinate synthase